MQMRKTIVLLIALVSVSICFGQTAEEYYEKGIEKYSSGDVDGARRDFNKAIKLNPNFAEAYTARGNARQRSYNQDTNGALSDYTKAIQLDPDQIKAYVNRGLLRSRSEDYQGAIEDFSKAIEIDPNYAKGYRFRGDSKKLMGNEPSALADYEAASEIELRLSPAKGATDTTEVLKVVEAVKENPVVLTDSKNLVVDLTEFKTIEKDINFAGLQLQNARKTFGVGFFLSLLGGALATGGYFAKDEKVQTGLIVAGGITSLVGSVVMITAVIPIGGAGKILQGVRFPNTLPVKVE
jgi:tetratricopeptide (TPR) repeat protein